MQVYNKAQVLVCLQMLDLLILLKIWVNTLLIWNNR